MTIITRFAPSPTGYLHIGGARTALFNYLFARHHQGKFLLRIEDTDQARSTQPAVEAIINGLQWLDINWDDSIVYQSARADRHAAVAHELVAQGKAYYCFTPQTEVNQQREQAIAEHRHFIFASPWRQAPQETWPNNIKPVVRLKAPRQGQTIIKDLLQGDVVVENSQLDDMVLLRSDGTPTYMLSVVVDDFDMKISHIIRGDDHLGNAARQMLLYQAMQWPIPEFVHIPLIHGMDGSKLSKRHGALGIDAYQAMGYLPEALCNYLLRLGWSHGDTEFISRTNAIEWFNLTALGKSPSRLDFDKMQHVNAHYIKQTDNNHLAKLITDIIAANYSHIELDQQSEVNILLAIESLKPRAKTLNELAAQAIFFTTNFMPNYDEAILDILKTGNQTIIKAAIVLVEQIKDFTYDTIQTTFKDFASQHNINISEIMKIFRILMTGQIHSSSIFAMMVIIGKDCAIKRLNRFHAIII